MLRLRPCVMRIGVGKNEYSPVARDDSSFAARVAWQTRVSSRIQVARADASTFGIARSRRFGSLFVFDGSRGASRDRIRDQSRVDRRTFLREKFFACHDATLDQQSLGRREPSFVVARRKVARGRYPLDRVTKL